VSAALVGMVRACRESFQQDRALLQFQREPLSALRILPPVVEKGVKITGTARLDR
jgi:hypothetical protein